MAGSHDNDNIPEFINFHHFQRAVAAHVEVCHLLHGRAVTPSIASVFFFGVDLTSISILQQVGAELRAVLVAVVPRQTWIAVVLYPLLVEEEHSHCGHASLALVEAEVQKVDCHEARSWVGAEVERREVILDEHHQGFLLFFLLVGALVTYQGSHCSLSVLQVCLLSQVSSWLSLWDIFLGSSIDPYHCLCSKYHHVFLELWTFQCPFAYSSHHPRLD